MSGRVLFGVRRLNLLDAIRRRSPTLAVAAVWAVACTASPDGAAPDPSVAVAIAGYLDSLNGLPTVVVNGFSCNLGVEECVSEGTGPPMSRLDAKEFAGAFAAARGIPLVEPAGFHPPRCPWTATDRNTGGLYALFVRPSEIGEETAMVELSTGCDEGGAFEQVHRFRLRKEGSGWVVVQRERTSIT